MVHSTSRASLRLSGSTSIFSDGGMAWRIPIWAMPLDDRGFRNTHARVTSGDAPKPQSRLGARQPILMPICDVALDLPSLCRQGRSLDGSASSSNSMMEGPWCRFRREARTRESDIDTATVDTLKTLDPNRPIREGDIGH